MTTTKLFDIECQGDTVIVIPTMDLGEFDYEELAADAEEVFSLLEKSDDKNNVVIDFRNTDYFGSTSLGVFLSVWKRVRQREGRMAFCNLSEHEKEILTVTKLDNLWSICATREEAMKTVSG